jgi:hypothetical protein
MYKTVMLKDNWHELIDKHGYDVSINRFGDIVIVTKYTAPTDAEDVDLVSTYVNPGYSVYLSHNCIHVIVISNP